MTNCETKTLIGYKALLVFEMEYKLSLDDPSSRDTTLPDKNFQTNA